jgi:flagellar hook-associated protein 3 FlgL
MVSRVTTPGNYAAVLANLLAAQQRQMDAGERVSTTKNGSNLKDYARDAELLTAMQSINTRIGAYQDQNDLTAQKLSTQDTALKRVADSAQNVRQILADALASDRVDTLMEDVEAQMRDAVEGLNARWGGKYLFAGGQVDTQPVTVTALADLTAGPPLSSFFQNDQFKAKARIDENTDVTTGILADAVGTNLMAAFKSIQQFQESGSGPFTGQMTAAQRSFLEGQLATWEQVRSDVTTVAARNGTVQQRLDGVTQDLVGRGNTLQGMLGKITDADMAKASADLQQAQLSVQSAAYVFQTLQQSSLINLLKQ